METAFMVGATAFIGGLWLAAIGMMVSRGSDPARPIGPRRQAVGERVALLGWVLILLGLVLLTVVGLIFGWRWAA